MVPREHNALTNMHRIVFDHINDLFPASNGTIIGQSGAGLSKNGYINGAKGATGQ